MDVELNRLLNGFIERSNGKIDKNMELILEYINKYILNKKEIRKLFFLEFDKVEEIVLNLIEKLGDF